MAQLNNNHTISTISIIVPTYNEKETIISFLEKVTHQISKNNFDSGIIVVDDGSPDGTAELIANFSKTHTNITLLNRREKRDWLLLVFMVLAIQQVLF
ncbi:MAG: glycosyltransferase [Candidatus Brocadia sp.]